MKLGYLTSYSKEEIELAKKLKFDSIELSAGWCPDSKKMAETESKLPEMKEVFRKNGIAVSAVAIYGNYLNVETKEVVKVFKKAANIAKELNCNIVATMAGRDDKKNVDENMPLIREKWGAVAKLAEGEGVKIAFEPWPGGISGHGPYSHFNLAGTPELWERIFNEVNSDAIGIEYDPSHLLWQEIDYIKAIDDFCGRIYHMHAKDTLIDKAKLAKRGVHGSGWWRFTIPGEGNVNWAKVFAALKKNGYKGDIAIEHEDENYANEKRVLGLEKGRDFLRKFVK